MPTAFGAVDRNLKAASHEAASHVEHLPPDDETLSIPD